MPKNDDERKLRLWDAYLIGYWNGIKAMQTAIPTGDTTADFGVDELCKELDRRERELDR